MNEDKIKMIRSPSARRQAAGQEMNLLRAGGNPACETQHPANPKR